MHDGRVFPAVVAGVADEVGARYLPYDVYHYMYRHCPVADLRVADPFLSGHHR